MLGWDKVRYSKSIELSGYAGFELRGIEPNVEIWRNGLRFDAAGDSSLRRFLLFGMYPKIRWLSAWVWRSHDCRTLHSDSVATVGPNSRFIPIAVLYMFEISIFLTCGSYDFFCRITSWRLQHDFNTTCWTRVISSKLIARVSCTLFHMDRPDLVGSSQ